MLIYVRKLMQPFIAGFKCSDRRSAAFIIFLRLGNDLDAVEARLDTGCIGVE